MNKNCSTCSSEKHYAKGYCKKCYDLNKHKSNLSKGKICVVEGCKSGVNAKNLCRKHYNLLISRTNQRVDPVRRYTELKSQAKKKDRNMDLTFEEFSEIALMPCFYCHTVFTTRGSGIDRLCSEKGYTKDNSVSCCWECNRIKGNGLTVEEMKLVARVLKEHRLSSKRKTVYMCGIDWQHEFEQNCADIYGSVEQLKINKSTCWKECGIVRVELDEKGIPFSHKWLVKQNIFGKS